MGGIGAGKSTVASILRELGCVVSDSDAVAREALSDPSIRERLRERWGDRVLAADGAVDRRAVAGIVFTDPTERRWLESLTHPWIEVRRQERFASAPSAPALVIDAPLLLESGLDRQCDAILFVDAPREQRLARVRATRGWEQQELALREAAQWPLDRKRAMATEVIVNDGDPAAIRPQVARALDRITHAANRPTGDLRHE